MLLFMLMPEPKFCLVFTSGRLPDSARMYGDVFVNGSKSLMPHGTYVSYISMVIMFDIRFMQFCFC